MVKFKDQMIQIIPRKDQFRYLGSIIQRDREINENVTHRIKASWLNGKLHLAFYMIVRFH